MKSIRSKWAEFESQFGSPDEATEVSRLILAEAGIELRCEFKVAAIEIAEMNQGYFVFQKEMVLPGNISAICCIDSIIGFEKMDDNKGHSGAHRFVFF